MTLAKYFMQHTGEFVLLLVSAGCFSLVAHRAFFLDSTAGIVPLTFVVVAVLLVALFVAAYRRQNTAFGIVTYVALVALLIGVSLVFSTGENIYDDAEGNYLYWALVIVFSATASFLLNRSLFGSALWFLVTAFACSIIQGFYQNNAVVESLVAVGAALVLVIYRNFTKGLYEADVAQEKASRGRLMSALVPVVGIGALALAVWFLVIAPLNPSVVKLALITDYKQLPIVEMRGVVDEQPELDLSLTSDQLTDGFQYTTDDLVEGKSDVVLNAQQVLDQQMYGGGSTDEGQGSESGSMGGLDESSLEEEYDTQSYSTVFPVGVIILMVVLVLAALIGGLFALRRWWRMRRLRTMLSLPTASEQIQAIYRFLLSRLAKVGIIVPPGTTLSEFSGNASLRLSQFDNEASVSFAALTKRFEACLYGKAEATKEDVVPFVSYYLSFWKAARELLGPVKYFWKSFRL